MTTLFKRGLVLRSCKLVRKSALKAYFKLGVAFSAGAFLAPVQAIKRLRHGIDRNFSIRGVFGRLQISRSLASCVHRR